MKTTTKILSATAALFATALSAFASVTITTTSKTFTKDGGAASVSTGGDGSWTATTDAGWISFSRGSGNAGVSCVYTVSANYSADTRSATIDIAGNIYTVTQTGYTASISPANASADYAGGGGSITVTCDAGVAWTAVPNVDWLSVSPASGMSNGGVTYTIAPYNVGVTTRTGSITIAGQTFTVSQTGTDVTLSPYEKERDYRANVFEVEVSALSSTHWSITPSASWISVVDEGYGYGNATVLIAVGQNPSVNTRTGTVVIGSKTLTVTQTGMTAPVLSITPTEATASPVGAYGNVAVYATPDATWSAESLANWITISEGATGAGNGNIKYVAAANSLLTERTGQIRVVPPAHIPDPDIHAGLALKITDGVNEEGGANRYLAWSSTAKCADYDNNYETRQFDRFNLALGLYCPISTYGNAKWYVVTDETKDGLAMRSGKVGDHQSSSLKATVSGPGTISFWVKTSMYGSSEDNRFTFSVDGVEKLSLVGEKGWALYSYSITGSGLHELVWTFSDTWSGCNSGSMCGWLDQVTWEPDDDDVVVGSLSTAFNGTNPLSLNGLSFRPKSDNAFSTAVSFKVGELDRVNRLLTIGGSSVYLDEGNRIVFNKSASSWHAEFTGKFYTVVVRQTDAGMVSIFAGERGGELEKVLEVPCASILDFGDFVRTDNFKLGYCDLPSPGNLTAGYMANFRVWTRALSDTEAERADVLDEVVYDSAPRFVPNGVAWDYYPLDGNVLGTSSANAAPHRSGSLSYGLSISDDHRGVAQRAVKSDATGFVVIDDMEALFGKTETSATYSLWFRLDELPVSGTEASIVYRSGYDTLDVSVTSDGAVRLDNNGSVSVFDSVPVQRNNWHMLTVVGVSGRSIQVYLDDTEIGNVATSMSLGYTAESRCGVFGHGACAIDDLSIFHAALTSAQVRQLYNASRLPIVYHTVTQGVIDPVVAPAAVSFDAAGGSTNVQLTVAANTQWTASASTDWIALTSSASSAGSARVSFDVAPNPSTEERTGTVTLAGKTVAVTQSGLWSQLTYDGTVFSEVSDSGFIDVQVEGNGEWTATTDADWLMLLDDKGSGSASVMFVVDDFNTTVASRTATIRIAGKTVTITQRGYELSIDPAVAEIGSNAGAGEIGITAPIDAVWEAIVTADWISLVGGTTGVGSGTLRYTVADNKTGGTRTGKIVISGQEYTVTQHANLTLATKVEGQGTVSGAGDYETNEQATLVATPAKGYAFTHWSGDAVGVSPTVSFIMDSSKTVTAHFIPEAAAQRLAEEKAAQGGFYTRDQIHNMELGNLLIDVDTDGKARIGVRLQETSSLSSPDWKPVNVTKGDIDIGPDGSVGIKTPATGGAKFFRVISGE